ncbi:MAG: hypothetical protein KJN89_06355 [Gammaproteobacteria bacterium]|nr:hypothetical protein [Gammaproteobacteria bacterium]NNJ49979.1 hypothetical protein [Gammaproteobacteria bacterium]
MRACLFLIGLALHFLVLPTASATSVLPLTLEQLSTRASLIIYAEVISNEVKKDDDSGHIATFTEFKIIDLIKGSAAETHTIKQIGGHHKATNTRLVIHGVPEFQTGNKYVVFLPEGSSLGFSSPLGLHQGSFSVTIINNEPVVISGSNLSIQPQTRASDIQLPLAVRADKPTQSRLADFINTVRAYNAP